MTRWQAHIARLLAVALMAQSGAVLAASQACSHHDMTVHDGSAHEHADTAHTNIHDSHHHRSALETPVDRDLTENSTCDCERACDTGCSTHCAAPVVMTTDVALNHRAADTFALHPLGTLPEPPISPHLRPPIAL